MVAEIKPVLRYPGAKWMLADWIIDHMPAHESYIEPFFGSGAVFFNKPPAKVETINDIDARAVNLFRVVRDRSEELCALIDMTPWARDEFEISYHVSDDPLEDARRFLVRCWQAFGTRLNTRCGWRNDTNADGRGTSYTPTWNMLPQRILAVVDRLKQAQIENRPALELITRHRHHSVLIYCDPPYVLSTRSGPLYHHEMTDADHIELLEALIDHPGPVLISGYENALYAELLGGWHIKRVRGFANSGKATEEILWLNDTVMQGLRCPTLFDEVGEYYG